MKTAYNTPGTRHDYKTGQYFPTLDGVDLSPSSFDEERAMEIAREASRAGSRLANAAPDLKAALLAMEAVFQELLDEVEGRHSVNPQTINEAFDMATDAIAKSRLL